MFRKSRLSVQRKNEFHRLKAERASADMAENNLVVRIPLEVWREARVVNLEQLRTSLVVNMFFLQVCTSSVIFIHFIQK